MSRICPVNHSKVLYLDCLECDDKICRQNNKIKSEASGESTNIYNKIVIGIDQSYKDTGITITLNKKVKCVTECYTEKLKNNSDKRKALSNKLDEVINLVLKQSNKLDNCEIICIIERIRLQSQGFINIDYIKSIGALNALIVDKMSLFNIPVYSVDTRAWKSSVVGDSKGKYNKYGIDEKKWPTILWCISKGYKKYIIDYNVGKRKKGIIEKEGKKYTYNDNKADSICISLYGFEDKQLLKEEH